MAFSFSKEYSASTYTSVENVFLKEYLPIASGNAVKVYLYGLFACQDKNKDLEIEELSEVLNITKEEIIDCLKFWEEFGVLAVSSFNPLSVIYYPLTKTTQAKPKKIKAEKYTEFTRSLQMLIPDRMIGTSEYTEYFTIMETYSIKPEAMLMIVNYCIGLKGQEISYRYVSKVAKDFGERGINTTEKIEKELDAYIFRTNEINKILTALSLKRKPEIEDLNLLNKWTEDLGFELSNVIFAAKYIKRGSMLKLDELLLELYSMKCFSKEEIAEYSDKKRKSFDLAIKINKALSIYMEVIDPVVDNYVNKWLSYGYTEETLLLIANKQFLSGKNTLNAMDENVEALRKGGYVTLTAVSDYFEDLKKTDNFIGQILLSAGINRRPNEWDRNNYKTWKLWNFSDEMILEAAKLSTGKSSAIAYMNAILSGWKNSGTFTIDSTSKQNSISPESYNKEFERRREIAISKAQKNLESAMELDGFKAVYSRLNSIEKDLAFAEISEDNEKLNILENEKKSLLEKQRKLLKEIGLTEKDLSPDYKCKKCNDTGYVGTKKCDCF